MKSSRYRTVVADPSIVLSFCSNFLLLTTFYQNYFYYKNGKLAISLAENRYLVLQE